MKRINANKIHSLLFVAFVFKFAAFGLYKETLIEILEIINLNLYYFPVKCFATTSFSASFTTNLTLLTASGFTDMLVIP